MRHQSQTVSSLSKWRFITLLLVIATGVEARDPTIGGIGSATVGDDIFLQGQYLQLAINPSGALGSRKVNAQYPFGGSPVPAWFSKVRIT
jgi:hypothetical protein